MKRPVKVRETDDYLESPPSSPNNEPTVHPWVRNTLQPLIIGVMVMCIAISIVQFIRTLAPEWNGTLLVVVPIIAALTGHYTYRIAHKRYLSGTDLLQFQLIELAFMFIAIKFAGYLDNTVPEVMADVGTWSEDWMGFFDRETIITFVLAFGAWFAAWATTNDLEELGDPTMIDKGHDSQPTERMSRRFFIGGLLLLFFAGAARTNWTQILNTDRPRVPGLVLNALVYFVGGLIILGQLRFTRLVRIWQSRQTRFTATLSMQWVRYSVLFLGAVLVISFLLPTHYTLGLLDLVNMFIGLLTLILTILYFVIITPIALLLSLFIKMSNVPTLPNLAPTIVRPAVTQASQSTVPLWEILRSVFFWVVVLGAIYYVMRSYLRDRPELWATMQRFRPLAIVIGWLRSLGLWLRGLGRRVGTQVKQFSKRMRTLRRNKGTANNTRKRGQDVRQRKFYHYFNTLDQAREAGIPRRATQTPYEYDQTLSHQIETAQHDMTHLTETFVEARYSEHILDEHILERLTVEAEHVQTALHEMVKSEETEI